MPRENHRPLDAPRLLTALIDANVAFVVVGGMAAVAQGSAYITVDLDICYHRTPENLQRLCDALRPLRPQLRGAPTGPTRCSADIFLRQRAQDEANNSKAPRLRRCCDLVGNRIKELHHTAADLTCRKTLVTVPSHRREYETRCHSHNRLHIVVDARH